MVTFSKKRVSIAIVTAIIVTVLILGVLSLLQRPATVLLKQVENTALPSDAYLVLVAPNEPEWRDLIAGSTTRDIKSMKTISEGAQWVSYAEAETSEDFGFYSIVTLGYETVSESRQRETYLLDASNPGVNQFIWRRYGSTIQGIAHPDYKKFETFPKEAPVIDIRFKGTAIKLNATRWVNVLKNVAPEREQPYLTSMVHAAGISTDVKKPTIISAYGRGGVLKGHIEGVRKKSLQPQHIASYALYAREELCPTEDNESTGCVVEDSNLLRALDSVYLSKILKNGEQEAYVRAVGEDFSSQLKKQGHVVGQIDFRSVSTGVMAGQSYQPSTRFQYWEFSINPKNGDLVLIPVFLTEVPEQ